MSKLNLIFLIVFIYLIVLQVSYIECRPRTQKLVIHGHEWTVPDEPGWEEVLREVEAFRHKNLTNCSSSRQCRLAAEELRRIFLKHAVSAKYYDDSLGNDFRSNDIDSIFKWG